MSRFVVWRGVDEWRAEACAVELDGDRLQAAGVQLGAAYRLDYRLRTGSSYVTERLQLAIHDAAGRRELDLRRDPDGVWTANGEPLPDVEGALDCDLAFSPLTNYMPARRLGSEPRDHVMAWVDVPSLEVLRSAQRYEPVGDGLVRYVGLDDGFTADLELDRDGLVVRYPGLAERVAS
jgi:uncharacterized protein